MPITIPPGFTDLIGRVRRYWGYSYALPETQSDFFDDLVYWSVLSGITNSAQNEYLYRLIEEFTVFGKVRDTWSMTAKKNLATEQTQLSKELRTKSIARVATQLKLDAVKKVLERRVDLNNTLLDAQEVIPRIWKEEGKLEPWRNNKRVIDLVAEIAHQNGKYKISGFGYIKATKWLQSCGVGQELVAPMTQTAKFLAEFCNCSEFRRSDNEYKHLGGLDEVEMPQVLVDWGPMNVRCQELAAKTSKSWANPEIVGDTIHVVIYVRGLMRFVAGNQTASRRVTCSSLLGFLQRRRLPFGKFMEGIYDVEKVPEIVSELENYLS